MRISIILPAKNEAVGLAQTIHKILDLTSGFRAVCAECFREFLHLLPNEVSCPTTSTMASYL